tara:strand:+ start:58977 stop:59738 length:762 start_codon:yes stop_codon:yes gene_type:complete
MEDNKPKILIGAPTAAPYMYCLAEYVARVKELSYDNYDVVLVDNSETEGYKEVIESFGIKAIRAPEFISDSRERLAASRNILRKKALDEGYDYFLSLEQDVIPPKDIIEQLLQHKKKVMTGVYFKPVLLNLAHKGEVVKQVKKLMPLLGGFIPGMQEKMHWYSAEEVTGRKIIQVRFSGLGCVLMHRDVLEKIKFRVEKRVFCHDDVWFSHDLYDKGFALFCDTYVKCKHLLKEKPKNLFLDCKKDFNPNLVV